VKPADRVEVMRQVAAHFEAHGTFHAEIRMILLGFKIPCDAFPETGYWYSHLLDQLGRAPEAGLVDLYNYLVTGGDLPTTSGEESVEPDATSDLWKPGAFRLFLSHYHSIKKDVAAVKKELAFYNIEGFVAHEDIEPAKEWLAVIEEALGSCHALAAFLTADFHPSKWCDHEVGYALGRKVQVIPVRLGADPYGLMGQYQGLQGVDRSAASTARDIFETLLAREKTAAHMAQALVSKFVSSGSFKTTRETWPLLQKIQDWTPPLLEQLRRALKENNQIHGVNWDMANYKAFLRKHGVEPY
jgi:hypothetical protein